MCDTEADDACTDGDRRARFVASAWPQVDAALVKLGV
jgi:hypothetical protein